MSFWKKKGIGIDSADGGEGRLFSAPFSTGSDGSSPNNSANQASNSTPADASIGGPTSNYEKIRCAVGPGTSLKGKLSFDSPVRVDGKLAGQVVSTHALIVGESGSLEADVDAPIVVIMGKFKGNIRADERIELGKASSVEGVLMTPKLRVADGAFVSARCVMEQAGQALTTAA